MPLLRFDVIEGRTEADVDHEREQIVLVGDVAVERHRGEAELLGHPRHGYRVQALGVGDPDGRFLCDLAIR